MPRKWLLLSTDAGQQGGNAAGEILKEVDLRSCFFVLFVLRVDVVKVGVTIEW